MPLELRLAAVLILACRAAPALAATPATLPDTLEQRLAPCIACHGSKEKADAFFPRIAGKPAGYLYNQLLNFRDGRRHYPMMTYMVDHLPDAYLREIAEYFSSLHPPYPPSTGGSAASATEAMQQRGKELVLHGDTGKKIPACVACHGEQLTGVAPAIPGLIGLPPDYINAQFGSWKNKVRSAHAPDCMGEIARRLSNDDVAAVSGWLGRQTPDANARPAATIAMPLPLQCGSVPAQQGEQK